MSTVTWDDFARLASAPVTVTIRGRVSSSDDPAERLAFAPADFWRIETDDGRLTYLVNDEGHYRWSGPEGGPACFQPRRAGYWTAGGANGTALVRPRELVTPIDDDFTRPLGTVQEITVIGRTAWRVLLAPPPRKPLPVWHTVDVQSGVTLAYHSPDGEMSLGFTSLATGVELPPDTFTVPTGDD